MSTYSNVSLTATGISGSAGTISISGAGGPQGAVLTTSASTGTSWTATAKTTAQGKLHLEGENADIVMNGVSLKEILNGITNRLAILQPKPELLAKYENLREAYEHYKTLEALLHQEDGNE